MTTKQRIEYATARGMDNAGPILRACADTDTPDAAGLALFELETGGRAIYGHDPGGALSTGRAGTSSARTVTVCGVTYPPGADIPVTPQTFAVFLILVSHGVTSNGVNIGQATYDGDLPDGRWGGYFRLAAELGYDLANVRHAAEFSLGYIFNPGGVVTRDLEGAFGGYNGGPKWRDDAFARRYAQRGVAAAVDWQRGFTREGI